MKEHDTYKNIAEYYDYMLQENPERKTFFTKIFKKNNITSVLDCACGTGNDLLMFNLLGFKVTDSDLSDSMLDVAKEKIKNNKVSIETQKVDFHKLSEYYDCKFDAVVCLSNAVNENDIDIYKALNSFKSVLNKNGIIIFDQGQTDFTMKNPLKYFPEVNHRDFTRLYTMDYSEDLMKVEIFDFLHTEEKRISGIVNFL